MKTEFSYSNSSSQVKFLDGVKVYPFSDGTAINVYVNRNSSDDLKNGVAKPEAAVKINFPTFGSSSTDVVELLATGLTEAVRLARTLEKKIADGSYLILGDDWSEDI